MLPDWYHGSAPEVTLVITVRFVFRKLVKSHPALCLKICLENRLARSYYCLYLVSYPMTNIQSCYIHYPFNPLGDCVRLKVCETIRLVSVCQQLIQTQYLGQEHLYQSKIKA